MTWPLLVLQFGPDEVLINPLTLWFRHLVLISIRTLSCSWGQFFFFGSHFLKLPLKSVLLVLQSSPVFLIFLHFSCSSSFAMLSTFLVLLSITTSSSTFMLAAPAFYFTLSQFRSLQLPHLFLPLFLRLSILDFFYLFLSLFHWIFLMGSKKFEFFS